MKHVLFVSLFCFFSFSGYGAEYSCRSANFPRGAIHAFQNGVVILTVNRELVTLHFYQGNTLTSSSTYQLTGAVGGNSAFKDHLAGRLVGKSGGGSKIPVIYFEPRLITNSDGSKGGEIGKFAFDAQGYMYDWNICYNLTTLAMMRSTL